MAEVFQGVANIPAGAEIVPSGDYKSADPAAVVMGTQGAASLRVTVSVTAASGGGGVTVSIFRVDPSTGLKTTAALASALIAATGTTELVIDPRIAASANAIAQQPLGSRMRVECVGSGVRTTLTYQVSATLAN